MEYRPLGRTGVQVSKLCLGTMMFGAWGNTDHDDSIRIIHARARRRDQLRRHRRRLLGRRVGGDRRQGAQGPPRRRRAGHQVLRADGRGPQPRAAARAAGSSPRSRTRCGASAPTGSTSTRSTAPTRTPTSRRRSARSPTSSSRARSATSARPRSPPAQIVEAQWAARERRLERFRTEQPPYSLLVRGIELDVLPDRAAPRHGHPHLQPAGRRLAVGQLDAPTARRPRRRASGWPRASTCRCRRTSASSKPSSSSRRSPTTPACRSSSWRSPSSSTTPRVTSAIIGPRTMEQLDSQLPAADVALDAAILDRIDEIVAARRQPQPRRHQLRRAGPPAVASAPAGRRLTPPGSLVIVGLVSRSPRRSPRTRPACRPSASSAAGRCRSGAPRSTSASPAGRRRPAGAGGRRRAG